LGELAWLQGDITKTYAHLEESLQISRQVGILRRVAATQRLLGDVARTEGRPDEADGQYREAFALATQLEDRPQQARILLSRAQLHLPQRQEMVSLLQNALAIYEEIGDSRGQITTLLLLVQTYLRQRRFELAIQPGISLLKGIWRVKRVHPRVLIGILKRWGKW
jgi:tetratricopeptide (TPR) repeat protein